MKKLGIHIPDNYMVMDIETTGFDRDRSMIVQWAVCAVRDGVVTHKESQFVAWNHVSGAREYISAAFEKIASDMAARGDKWALSTEQLDAEGVHCEDSLRRLHELVSGFDGSFVAHNGVRFDFPMIESHFRAPCELSWEFPRDRMLDTGLIVKASQLDMVRAKGESAYDWFMRVSNKWSRVKWALGAYCVPTYGLTVPAGASTHDASCDVELLRQLVEKLKACE